MRLTPEETEELIDEPTHKIVQKEESVQYLLRAKDLTEDGGIDILVDSVDRLSRAIATGNANNIRRASMMFIQESAILPLRMLSKFVWALDTRIKILPVDRELPNSDKIERKKQLDNQTNYLCLIPFLLTPLS